MGLGDVALLAKACPACRKSWLSFPAWWHTPVLTNIQQVEARESEFPRHLLATY